MNGARDGFGQGNKSIASESDCTSARTAAPTPARLNDEALNGTSPASRFKNHSDDHAASVAAGVNIGQYAAPKRPSWFQPGSPKTLQPLDFLGGL